MVSRPVFNFGKIGGMVFWLLLTSRKLVGTVSRPIWEWSEIARDGLPTIFELPKNRRDGLLTIFDHSENGRDGLPRVFGLQKCGLDGLQGKALEPRKGTGGVWSAERHEEEMKVASGSHPAKSVSG